MNVAEFEPRKCYHSQPVSWDDMVPARCAAMDRLASLMLKCPFSMHFVLHCHQSMIYAILSRAMKPGPNVKGACLWRPTGQSAIADHVICSSDTVYHTAIYVVYRS